MARTIEELDAAVAALEDASLVDRLGAQELNLVRLSSSVGELGIKVSTLTTRVTQLDGIGLLPDPARGLVAQLAAQVNGMNTTIQQLALVLQADQDLLKQSVETLTSLVNQTAGV